MACVLLALTAAPAMGSSCGSLYGPGLTLKHTCAVTNPAIQQRYFKALGAPVSRAQLRTGRFRDGLAASSSTAARRRAGVGAGSLGVVPLLVVGAVALALAGLATRRRAAVR